LLLPPGADEEIGNFLSFSQLFFGIHYFFDNYPSWGIVFVVCPRRHSISYDDVSKENIFAKPANVFYVGCFKFHWF